MTFAVISSKGQLTVPSAARRALGLGPGSRVLIETRANEIAIRATQPLLGLKGFLGKAKPMREELAAAGAAAAKHTKGVL